MSEKQVGGAHYKNTGIQPVDYIRANNLGFFEGNVLKYITRHRDKNGREDIEKAIHYLEFILEDYDSGRINNYKEVDIGDASEEH